LGKTDAAERRKVSWNKVERPVFGSDWFRMLKIGDRSLQDFEFGSNEGLARKSHFTSGLGLLAELTNKPA
jgi:hypothetical protein